MQNSPRTPAPPQQSTSRAYRVQRRFDGSRPSLDLLRSLIAAHCG